MRHIPLQGASNFRDFGGYETASGRKMRLGRLYRSDRLNGLSEADFEVLNARGIRLVCDLRRESEAANAATAWRGDPAPELMLTSLFSDQGGKDVMGTILGSPELRNDPAQSRELMINYYRRLMREPQPLAGFRTIFQRLANDESYPFLVHCSGGKDRTGVVCALIHLLDGVSREDLMQDYLLTLTHYEGAKNLDARVPQIMAGLPFDDWTPAALAPVFTVEAAYLEAMLETLDADWGTVERFLTESVGVTADDLERVREHTLEA